VPKNSIANCVLIIAFVIGATAPNVFACEWRFLVSNMKNKDDRTLVSLGKGEVKSLRVGSFATCEIQPIKSEVVDLREEFPEIKEPSEKYIREIGTVYCDYDDSPYSVRLFLSADPNAKKKELTSWLKSSTDSELINRTNDSRYLVRLMCSPNI